MTNPIGKYIFEILEFNKMVDKMKRKMRIEKAK